MEGLSVAGGGALLLLAVLVGALLGALVGAALLRRSARHGAAEVLRRAEDEARAVRERALADERRAASAADELRLARELLAGQRAELERREERLAGREERLGAETASAARAAARAAQDLRAERADLQARLDALDARERALGAAEREQRALLERTAGLTAAQARTEVVAQAAPAARREAEAAARSLERRLLAEAQDRAREVVVQAVQRVVPAAAVPAVTAQVVLPAEEVKGRVIGRDGRNVRAFEAATGVDVVIDDTPRRVLVSCFDPVRREVARHALAALVADGRIHPQRIEEQVERTRAAVDEDCRRAADEALLAVGVGDLHPELVGLLARLHLRTSYGQNVLGHLVETARLATVLAAEVGLDPAPVARGAFLHDLGKALTATPGTPTGHAAAGAEAARRCGEHPDVVHAIEAHHGEVEPRTAEAVLVQAADALSAGRPGARREGHEVHAERLHRLEGIALAHPGVERAYAVQGGHEVRVMVLPDVVDDDAARVLARDVAREVEDGLSYPGQVRVVVVRESRATAVAR
ncbi:ribonuclease Y [Vallicoccus soli]|uniref:Ribonuclease Y n=1 Tax=Vallicoccus soli TaxID=2339232 RepID=A0A3A3ZKM6_9ACTN|nr:ribonuclease Y [Vallicoccus soli]RJK96474.1 ribonuclease Y [Vallicoccus soli]